MCTCLPASVLLCWMQRGHGWTSGYKGAGRLLTICRPVSAALPRARPARRYVALRPLFRTEQLANDRYRSRVFLPNNAPLPSAQGTEQPGRKVAIAAAALEACKRLHEVGAVRGWGG